MAKKPTRWERVLTWLNRTRRQKSRKPRERRQPSPQATQRRPVMRLEEAFVGNGGHSKARPIVMIRGKNQSKWRKKLRRMDHRGRKKALAAARR